MPVTGAHHSLSSTTYTMKILILLVLAGLSLAQDNCVPDSDPKDVNKCVIRLLESISEYVNYLGKCICRAPDVRSDYCKDLQRRCIMASKCAGCTTVDQTVEELQLADTATIAKLYKGVAELFKGNAIVKDLCPAVDPDLSSKCNANLPEGELPAVIVKLCQNDPPALTTAEVIEAMQLLGCFRHEALCKKKAELETRLEDLGESARSVLDSVARKLKALHVVTTACG